jgi:formylglycine-generating enzyme required for sulfatase activity
MKLFFLQVPMQKLQLLASLYLLLSCFESNAQQHEITNMFGMQFVFIDSGKMVVGKYQPTVSRGWGYDPKRKSEFPQILPEADFEVAEQLASAASRPGFVVSIDKPYYIGKFEVTQSQWEKVMGSNPSSFNQGLLKVDTRNFPVESVSWNDAQGFIKKLNQLDTLYQYRLPTEFEWEYSARAGAQDDIAWNEINKVAVIAKSTPANVGSKQPNAWGLYDMLGNVWEWVADLYNEQIFADPVPPKRGKEHVLKGAPFYGDVKNATYMTHAGGPGSKYDTVFRLIIEKRSTK